MNKPKCTIYNFWTGPECGEPAVSMNSYGGFQCQRHNDLKPFETNKPGLYRSVLANDPDAENRLQEEYNIFLKSPKEQSRIEQPGIFLAMHNCPIDMDHILLKKLRR